MGDEVREALAEALTEAQLRGQLVWGTHETAAILLPVVDAIARRRAAEELRRVADWIWDDVPARASASAELHARADELDSQ